MVDHFAPAERGAILISKGWKVSLSEQLHAPDFVLEAVIEGTIRVIDGKWYLYGPNPVLSPEFPDGEWPYKRSGFHAIEDGDFIFKSESGDLYISPGIPRLQNVFYRVAGDDFFSETFKQDIAATINASGA